MAKKYTPLQIHKALKIVLGINYNFRWLDVEIVPRVTTWYVAQQFRNDPERRWTPRIIEFYPTEQVVVIFDKMEDPSPTSVKAETVIAMAETRAQSPDFKPEGDKK